MHLKLVLNFDLLWRLLIDIFFKIVLIHKNKRAAGNIAACIFNQLNIKTFGFIIFVPIKILLHSVQRLAYIIFKTIKVAKNIHKLILYLLLIQQIFCWVISCGYTLLWIFINIHKIHNTLQIKIISINLIFIFLKFLLFFINIIDFIVVRFAPWGSFRQFLYIKFKLIFFFLMIYFIYFINNPKIWNHSILFIELCVLKC